MQNNDHSAKTWRTIAIIALCALIIVAALYALGVGWKQARVDAVNEAEAKAQTTIDGLTADKEALQTENDTLTADKAALEADVAALTADKEAAQTANDTLTATAETLQADVAALTADKEAVQAANEALTAENVTLTTDKEAAQAANEALTAENATLTADKEAAQAANDALTAANAALQADVATLTADKDALQAANDTLTADMATLQETNASLTAAAETLQADVETLTADKEAAQAANATLTAENADLAAKMAELSVEPADEPEKTYLASWTEDAPARNELMSYMAAITEEGGADYIPPVDRIAVFDLDGTLFCETDPCYFDYCLLRHRVVEDEDYKDQASDFEREVAANIDLYSAGESVSGLEVAHGQAVASAFAGMTLKEFDDYVHAFRDTPAPSYEGMTRGEAYYQPMLEVVEYLIDNEFTVYVVSGTDRLIVRGVTEGMLNIPPRQIIGSDELLVASGQNGEDGLKYTFTDEDELVLSGEFIIKNLKTNKVTVIAQEIGQQPVLSFGNSTGDASMAEYVTSKNAYRSLAFMLCCDDTERENGNEKKAIQMQQLCDEFDWVPISMKNDWTTIYGEGVTKK